MNNYYIQQSISIQLIKIGGVSNSSVFQIGSAGIIKPSSHLYNTGGFTEPAPEYEETPIAPGTTVGTPLVPLTAPSKP
ncbi:spore germination protein GerPB [Cytobacillus sp. FSL W7-1323]|uniref:Spore gernimation protein n=1 Tax=Cytobacillus kochii TaxID=859143 RepID=A0A248TDJ4_9BACI|nr:MULTISPECIES: spore germination protein GerPB [Cytobacillus]ASV66275.1 spore gernimation protein [Cytobacillus kochii]MDQ0187056.1 spore germination protein PB [Cytobacillus kochii]MEA1851610.1 spore germination protein GerPB [Cytobacillus sp. OWB-43]MED1605679.1 spore germination protein GerPB [Cytobacillus kochii]